MDGLTLFWTETAKLQRDSVFHYWNTRNNSKEYSIRLNTAILERTELLKRYPHMGRPTELTGTRVVSLGHYSILYTLRSKLVIVTAFWDNRDDPKELLRMIGKD